jgi:hypothetical protein
VARRSDIREDKADKKQKGKRWDGRITSTKKEKEKRRDGRIM